MTDITKCSNKTCPKKDQCYRHTSKNSDWKSWAYFKADENGKCEYFWDNSTRYKND